MPKRILLIILLCVSCLTNDMAAQNIPDSPLLKQGISRHGFSANLTFELTTPSGSAGRWSTGGGATLIASYTYYIDDRWFISPGIGAFYNTMGTDFIPEANNIYEGTVKNYGARIPMLAGYRIRLTDDLSLALATGPTLNINVYAKEHPMPDFEAEVIEPEPVSLFGKGFHRSDLMWTFYAGITYKRHYCVGFQGSAGLTDVATMSVNQRTLNIHRNNIALMLSYTF